MNTTPPVRRYARSLRPKSAGSYRRIYYASAGFALAALLANASACSSPAEDHGPAQATGGSGALLPVPSSSSWSGASNGLAGAGTQASCSAVTPSGCAGVSFEGERVPLDIYILFDQSGSMLNDVGGMTRLAAVQRAVTTFLRDPGSREMGVGIGYFGTQPIGAVSCDPGLYSSAAVPISLDHEPIVESLARREPTGETPTGAALTGACSYVSSYARANPGRAAVTLLVTDGKPEAPVSCERGGCCPSLDEATRAVSDCLAAKPAIPTYVLGVGPNLDNLHEIARAGGTRNAYLVGDQDVTRNVLEALLRIRGDAQIPCDIEIPAPDSGQKVDYSAVNIYDSSPSCEDQPLYYVESAAGCGSSLGWHYDDAKAPARIQLCPSACELVNQPSHRLRVSVGCASIIPPPR